jgi:CheY-like chemotaxis protein
MSLVLVVEDDLEVRGFVAAVLRRAGHDVAEATDGLEGIRLCKVLQPEIVVSDVYMPGQDGIHLLREVKKQRPQVRVVLVSGGSSLMPDMDVLDYARKLGADATLNKPFTPYELMQAVAGQQVLN